MATTVFARGSMFGDAEIDNAILAWMNNGDFYCDDEKEDYFTRFKDRLIDEVNDLLPDDMTWFPALSEVWRDVDTDHSDIKEDFRTYFKGILDTAWDKADAAVEVEHYYIINVSRREWGELTIKATSIDKAMEKAEKMSQRDLAFRTYWNREVDECELMYAESEDGNELCEWEDN